MKNKPGHRSILVANVRNDLYDKVQNLARRKGKSMVGFIREILEAVVFEDEWINQGGKYDRKLGISEDRPYGL